MANIRAKVVELSSKQPIVSSEFYRNLTRTDIADVLSKPVPTLDFAVPGLIAGSVGAVIGTGGVGKSIWMLQVAASIAAGVDIAGIRRFDVDGNFSLNPAGEKVVILSAEDPEEIVATRLHALKQLILRTCPGEAGQKALGRLAENFFIISLLGKRPDLNDESQTKSLKIFVADARLVIIDTLRRFHTCSENDDAAMSNLVAVLESIARQDEDTKPAVIYLHHTNKAAGREGGSMLEASASRGSGVLIDNPRCQYNFAAMTRIDAKNEEVRRKIGVANLSDEDLKRYVQIARSKCNYASLVSGIWFERGDGGVLVPALSESERDHEVDTYEQERAITAEPGRPAMPAGQTLTKRRGNHVRH